ncbi:MAG: peptidoglycan-binding protein [Tissierellia bacterium]|nr:peptidoglycan-binding protein [Tissierellia bacterium]
MHNISNEFIKNPVMEIQLYLREIAQCKPEIPMIYPNGIFDAKTKEAVIAFQKIYNIPPTGKVDLTTWNALVNEDRLCYIKNKPGSPNRISIFPNNNHTCKLGDECDIVYVIQILLNNIGKKYKNDIINITGKYDAETEEAVKKFQKSNMLNITGIVDLETWNSLAHINNTCGFYSM